MHVLNIKELVFKYDERTVLEQINLCVNKGEIIVLLGPNGCGKTTLLDCIIGYQKHEQGSIRILGVEDKCFSIKDKAKCLAYVPQSSSNTFPYTVLEIVLMGRNPHIGKQLAPRKKDTEIAKEALSSLGIAEFTDRAYTKLSGGEKQLVLIARSLTQNADIILLDEPTSSLDVKNEIMVLKRIKEMVKKTGKTVLIATHQPNHAYFFENENLPVNVALFVQGRIKYFGAPSKVLTKENIGEVYKVDCDILQYRDDYKTVVVR